jgi:hypothetical protein
VAGAPLLTSVTNASHSGSTLIERSNSWPEANFYARPIDSIRRHAAAVSAFNSGQWVWVWVCVGVWCIQQWPVGVGVGVCGCVVHSTCSGQHLRLSMSMHACAQWLVATGLLPDLLASYGQLAHGQHIASSSCILLVLASRALAACCPAGHAARMRLSTLRARSDMRHATVANYSQLRP